MIEGIRAKIDCVNAEEARCFSINPGKPELSIRNKKDGEEYTLVFTPEQMETIAITAAQCAASEYDGINYQVVKELGEKIVGIAEKHMEKD